MPRANDTSPRPKSMQSGIADKMANQFARDHKLSLIDPIVRTLRNGLKRSLGYRRWRNELEAAKAAAQPSLFPQTAPEVPLSIAGRKEKETL